MTIQQVFRSALMRFNATNDSDLVISERPEIGRLTLYIYSQTLGPETGHIIIEINNQGESLDNFIEGVYANAIVTLLNDGGLEKIQKP